MDFDISEDGIPVFVYTDNEHPSIIKYKMNLILMKT